jgi:hypothetical protein
MGVQAIDKKKNSLGIGKDQSVILSSVVDLGQYNIEVFSNTSGKIF